jgi:hypothetical protein
MNSNDDLFSDQGPEFAPVPDRLEMVAGKVVATLNKPSAAQKRFNTLMARIDEEKRLADTLRHALDTHGRVHRQAMDALSSESERLSKCMVLLLDQRIQAPTKPHGLTPNQKQSATHMLLGLCEQLLETQDPEVDAILQRYDPQDDEEDDQDLREQAQAMAESYLGGDFAQGREFNSPEEVIRAAMEFEQQQMRAQAEKRDAKRAQRQAQKGQTAAQLAAEQKQLDAQGALRAVFRQLASALHPDREPDEGARARKTTLMSEVNAAYERKDLSTLLRIQLQEAQIDASKAGALSDAKLKAMCDILAEQAKALEADNWRVRNGMEYEFGYPAFRRFKETEFLAHMVEAREALDQDLAHMRADLASVQDDKGLKTWLKAQKRANKAAMRESEVFQIDDILDAMMRR